MWRVAILVLVLAVCAGARAEDDDAVLETPKPEGIPERLQALEREWAEDVGSKEAEDGPAEAADAEPTKEAHDAAAGVDDTPDDAQPAKPAPPEEEPSPAKRTSVLRSPLEPSTRAPAASKDPASVSPEKGTRPEPARKPLAREPTTPED